jgi:N-acetylglucosaminyldiphosphoundecaprenol N-acetyl-beta-D-mannosaminyltransferase
MPIIWIARLIGLPVKTKVSGSDIFDALKAPGRLAHQLNVFLFGGAEGVAEAAATTLNAAPAGLQSVGTLNPGFSTVADMSCDHILDNINVSNADFLVVALGAKKGQAWLHSNHYRLTVPIRVHLGAVINFQAGTVSRAPRWLRTWGLEWLWRIKEEPQLWRRYFYGGVILLSLLFTRILPLAVATRWYRLKSRHRPEGLTIEIAYNQASAAIRVRGAATEPNVELAIRSFQEVLNAGIKIATLDLSGLVAIDGRFFGLFFMLRKCLKKQGGELRFVGVPSSIQRMFRLHEVNFLLEDA